MREKIKEFMRKTADLRTEEQQKKYDESRSRRSKELQYWHHWNDNGRKPEHLEPLLKSIQPLVNNKLRQVQTGLGGSIPAAALRNELQNAALRGIQSYDPARGVPLTSHIYGNFRRASEFIAQNRNERYMPKEDVDVYQTFQNAKNELHEELGREPSHPELQTRLPGWSLAKIKKMSKGFGAEVYTYMGTEFDGEEARMRPRDAYMLIKSQMPLEEQRYADLAFPAEGAPVSVKDIAKRLGVSADRAYRLKAKVETRLQKVLKHE